MKKTYILILLIVTYCFYGCDNQKKPPKKEILRPVSALKSAPKKTLKTTSLDTVAITNDLKKMNSHKKNNFIAKDEIPVIPQIQNDTPVNNTLDLSEEGNKTLMTFANLRKILSGSKIGETLTQKQLTQNFEIPEEAVKIVKSITKTAEDEIAVKWRSTWFIEKVSDAKFKDGLMKIRFKANKLYTSGSAIGIKHDKRIYHELVIIGRSAYIPGVKGYSWQIGK
ncbi:hypothetical protein EV143_103253 [Flavobacterium chryseum]|uniref:hypothetical protein n=1 Tax=Flavobacterium sp. P3160 TaxID=2512113 RepID=UPI001061995C|nr:hypothetical protein [Flavobacterium sp. P3160]TDO78012.1 hypothetical protein EV143_103253 [Flavobacterium sp. P3160]